MSERYLSDDEEEDIGKHHEPHNGNELNTPVTAERNTFQHDKDELVQFRQAWKKEVLQKRETNTSRDPKGSPSHPQASLQTKTKLQEQSEPLLAPPAHPSQRSQPLSTIENGPNEDDNSTLDSIRFAQKIHITQEDDNQDPSSAGPSSIPSFPTPTVAQPSQVPRTSSNSLGAPLRLMQRAVKEYAQALGSERKGDLDDALVHYRKAFKLDSNADKLYDRASKALQLETEAASTGRLHSLHREMLIETDDVRRSIFKALDMEDHRFVALQEQASATDQIVSSAPAPPKISSPTSKKPAKDRAQNNGDRLGWIIERLSLEAGGTRDFDQVNFVPEDEESPVLLSRLPEEVLLHILTQVAAPKGHRGEKVPRGGSHAGNGNALQAHEAAVDANRHLADTEKSSFAGVGVILAGPDYMSIEQLGRTCWKFRLLTRTWSIWRLIVSETYFPPQIPSRVPVSSLIRQHNNDWRTTFVERPRIRLNGAYIAAYHYTRPGMHEDNVWVKVIHVVEFYRSLRFLPDGTVLSLLTTDPPKETVRRMEPSLRIKGFAIGHWTLCADGLSDDQEMDRPRGPKVVVDNLHDQTLPGYTFRLLLKLDYTGRGKWNRMEMLEYESINLNNGEVCPLPMNHKKPFHFSTVRSYGI